MQLRGYQEQALSDVWAALVSEHNVLLQAPTGAGKTIMFATLIKRMLTLHPGGRICVLAHRKELVQQAADKLVRVWPEVQMGVACTGMSKTVNTRRQVTIGSSQTMMNRAQNCKPFHLMIIDEAHRIPPTHEKTAQYVRLIDQFRDKNPEMRILGCTATPYRLGHGFIYGDEHKIGEPNFFERLHYQITVRELVDQGYLAPLRGKMAMPDGFMAEIKQIGKHNGDYAEGELSNMMSKGIHLKSAVHAYTNHASDRRAVIVFAVTIEHAEKLVEAFKADGISAEAVHSGMPNRRRNDILAQFRAGLITVLMNVGILIEGFDVPEIDTILMARPTLSPALFIQMIGRGLRPAAGKDDCLLIDLVGNTETHGTDLDAPRVKYSKAGEGEACAPTKVCPECEEICALAARQCQACGYRWEQETVGIVDEPTELMDVAFGYSQLGTQAEIFDVRIDMYRSRKGNDMLRLELHVLKNGARRPSRIFHYLSFNDQDSYFCRRSLSWWRSLYGAAEKPPQKDIEAIFMFEPSALMGQTINIVKSGDFDKVQGW